MDLSLEQMEKALASLERSLAQPLDEYTRDASIQRFEYCFELAWKLAKKTLAHYGISANAPRTVIRESAQQGWLANPEDWMDYLENRNLTVHTYNEETACKVYESARLFAPDCRKLLKALSEA